MWEAVKASVEAGKAIMKVYETDFSVSNKSDNSPLTQADMESHAIISMVLDATNIPILSEEGKDIPYSERKDWPVFWLVDPLDGTKEFVNRNDEFTVNIALIENSYPLAGVIYIPVTDELFLGLPGRGALKFEHAMNLIGDCENLSKLLKSGKQLPVNQDTRPYTVVCSRSHMSAETEAFIEELKSLHGQIDYASRGSSLKLCMLAEGKADMYPRFAPTMEWDTAAGQAIAESSGASVVHAHSGRRLQYNKKELLNPWFIVKR
ncbi:MAG: 3'(2'),5'-bisphosphate nucleotidase CysQ [Bacteroidales bacterium]|nr:3'(2'),5'-bisphosphate nucleotidase CysQ [Bacteroidales bacterium]